MSNMDRNAENCQGNVTKLSGNFTLSGKWSPCLFLFLFSPTHSCTFEYTVGRSKGQVNWKDSVGRASSVKCRNGMLDSLGLICVAAASQLAIIQ